MSQMPKRLDVTVEQLKSIYGQLYDKLEEKASLHLPAEAGEEHHPSMDDAVRKEVQLHLQDYLSQVMDMASSSLRVINANEEVKDVRALIMKSQEKYVEPFDLELNEQVRQKYEEWEEQTVKVSQLRQNAPREINRVYDEAKQDYLARLDARISLLQPEAKDRHDEDLEAEDQVLDTLESYWADLKSRYEESLQNLHGAQQQIPDARANVKKIQALVQFLEKEFS